MSQKEGPRIYNLFPRLLGKMDHWIEHFDRIKDLGFNWIYINPFHYAGFSGSLYAPKDYFDFNPMFVESGSQTPPIKQLENMIGEAHKRGLKVMMDLVINHTAKDHPFTKAHPDWYVRDEKGTVKSPGAWDGGSYIEWGDLAEIDNEKSPDRANLWKYWDEVVAFYTEKGFDGFRADAAYQVPTALWKELIGTAKKKNSKIEFFAESLGCTPEETLGLAQSGFDYIFNSSKWWDFQEDWLLVQYNQTRDFAPSVAFPESHDTPRLATEYRNHLPAIKQRIAFTAFFSSGWLMPIGCEFGFRSKTDVVSTYPDDWESVNYDISDFVRTINETKAKYAVFNEDNPIEIIDNDNWFNIIVMRKTSLDGKEHVIIAINKDVNEYQRLYYGRFYEALGVPHKTKIIDVSPENRLDVIPWEAFEYHLEPGEIKIVYAKTK